MPGRSLGKSERRWTMKTKKNSAASAAAALADDETVAQDVQALAERSRMVRTLVEMRLQKGLTQKQIAEGMGVDQSKVSRLENGYDDELTFADAVLTHRSPGIRSIFSATTRALPRRRGSSSTSLRSTANSNPWPYWRTRRGTTTGLRIRFISSWERC